MGISHTGGKLAKWAVVPSVLPPKAIQDSAAAAANNILLPEHSTVPDSTSRHAAKKKGGRSRADPIISSHRCCPDLKIEDVKDWERKDYGVTHFHPTRSSGPPFGFLRV